MSSLADSHDDHHHHSNELDVFGFWLYILTDCLLFATLFATYAVMHRNTFGGAPLGSLFSLPYVFVETLLLLFSSFTYGLAMLSWYRRQRAGLLFWLGLTCLLGISFVVMEVNEFVHLYAEGYSWHRSGALSAFFTLVGTHGLHVSIGLLWMLIMIVQLFKATLDHSVERKLIYLGLFWHFLDIVWIFVFTIVYLMGAI